MNSDFPFDSDFGLQTPERNKAHRRQFTPGFKADILRRIQSGESVADVAEAQNIHTSMIYRWQENQELVFLHEAQGSAANR